MTEAQIKLKNSVYYLFIGEHSMWKMKDDPRLKEMKIDMNDVSVNTFPTKEKDWYGTEIRETLVVLN